MFVERGLMIGEFHSANNATGLRNSSFYPLRTPYPCLAVRHMVPGDFVSALLSKFVVARFYSRKQSLASASNVHFCLIRFPFSVCLGRSL